jgi:hypothetical protein
MSPVELRALIESDAEALALARSGAADLCAARCVVIAPKIRASKVLTERGLYANLGPAIAETILQKLEGYAEAGQEYSALVKRFLKWLEPSNDGVDFGLQDTLDMAGLLYQGGLLTLEEYTAIDGLSKVAPTITGAEVSTAYPYPPQD